MMRIIVLYSPGLVGKVINLILTDADHEVLMTQDGDEALSKVGETEIDGVLIRTDIPDLDSIKLCKELRAVRFNGPILFLSHRTDLESKLNAFENGADDYLLEPFEPDELLARVEAMARRCRHLDQQPMGSVVKVGDAELSMGEMTFHSQGQPPVTLTPTEMRLLERLMRNAGITITRDTLIERTWGYDFFGDSNRVDVYIARIRKKIEPDPANPRYLHTIRGAGYVFRIPQPDHPEHSAVSIPHPELPQLYRSSAYAPGAE
jgi:two-component system, OmpR family, response regulator RegX3